jgi:transcriptional repressor NrdR
MRCPTCGHAENRVIDSREARDGSEIRRRRECLECGRRFTTRERLDETLPKLVKRDGRREDYAREKLVAGLQKACHKRAVSVDALHRAADRIEKRLSEQGERELPSRRLGEWVMEELVNLDAVAAARFASVFHGFGGPEDYARFFESLDKRPERG